LKSHIGWEHSCPARVKCSHCSSCEGKQDWYIHSLLLPNYVFIGINYLSGVQKSLLNQNKTLSKYNLGDRKEVGHIAVR